MPMTLLPYRPAHVAGTSKKKKVAKSLTRSRDIFARDKLEHVKSLLVELNPHWFPGNVYSKIQRSLPDEEEEASANDSDPFEQLDELQNALIQDLSDNALQERAIEAVKKDKLKQLLEGEMHLAEDPDVILEMNEEQLTVTESTSLQVSFQNILRKPREPKSQGYGPERVFQTRMQLLHGGRYYVGTRRGICIGTTLPMHLEILVKMEKYPDEHILVRAELSQPGERHSKHSGKG